MKFRDTIYEEYYNDLYNADMKIQFIEEKYPEKAATKLTILNNFRKAGIIEKQLDKDLCIFSIKDIFELAGSLAYASENTIRGALSFFVNYTDWCIENGQRGTNENGVNDFNIFVSTQELSQFVSRLKVEHRYITKDEVIHIVDNLENFIDKAIVLGLYEGIGGEKLHELISLKRNIIEDENFNNNNIIELVNLNGEMRTKTISNKLKYILKYASLQKTYLIGNGYTKRKIAEVYLVDSEYIIRTTNSTNNRNFGNMVGYPTMTQRMQRIKAYTGYDFITAKSIEDSGAINRVLELTKERGLEEPNDEIFSTLRQSDEFNYSDMQIHSLKQKFHLATDVKDFK